ncbi:MAG: hypothetical protein PHF84_12665 [bacterium]|nr:hypothetical protein [bacterium]
MKLEPMQKFVLQMNTEDSNYHFILYKDRNLYEYQDVRVQDFCFYRDNSLVFCDQGNGKLYRINIETDEVTDLQWTNRMPVEKISITPNNRKLVLLSRQTNLIIFDMENRNIHTIRQFSGNYLIAKNGVDLVYQKGRSIHFLNLYTLQDSILRMDEPFTSFDLSFSGRYLFYYSKEQLNYYDLRYNKKFTDVFDKNRMKAIEKIVPLNNDNLLLYGKLYDQDRNNRLDHRDLNILLYFDPFRNLSNKVLSGPDSLYELSNYQQNVLYRRGKSLWIKSMNNEEANK